MVFSTRRFAAKARSSLWTCGLLWTCGYHEDPPGVTIARYRERSSSCKVWTFRCSSRSASQALAQLGTWMSLLKTCPAYVVFGNLGAWAPQQLIGDEE